jgi:hypothetical protein
MHVRAGDWPSILGSDPTIRFPYSLHVGLEKGGKLSAAF